MNDYFTNDYHHETLVEARPWKDNFSMFIPPRLKNAYEGGYEKFSSRLTKNIINKCSLFIDVGANYGYYSLLASNSNENLKIIAIEPVEELFVVLKKNFLLNNISEERSQLVSATVASVSSVDNFYKTKESNNSDVLPQPNSQKFEQIQLNSISLDDLLIDENNKRIFIKTNTDGNELEVLKGLSKTFQKCNDITLLIEMNPKMLKTANTSCLEIVEFLHKNDFTLYAIDDNDFKFYALENIENLIMMESIYDKSYFNILCVKRGKALSVMFFSHSSYLYGAERCLLDLTRGLSERGVLCAVVLPDNNGPLSEKIKEQGCSVILPQSFSLPWLAGTRAKDYDYNKMYSVFNTINDTLIPEIRKVSPDIIFTQTIVSPWGAICADILGLPHVLSALEYGVLDHKLHFFYGFEKSMEALYNNSEVVFCITKDVRDTLFGDDIDNKATVIYISINIESVHVLAVKNQNEYLNEAGFKTPIAVGIFGTIMRSKGQKDLVNACLELSGNNVEIKCVLAGGVGEADYYKEICKIIEDSGYTDGFVKSGFVDDPFTLMNQMDIIVSCSEREAFGRTLIEAALLGKPIIYVKEGGPKEIFTDGVHGLAYNYGNSHELAEKILLTSFDAGNTKKRIEILREYIKKSFNDENYSGIVYKKLMELKNISKSVDSKKNKVADLLLIINTVKFSTKIVLCRKS